MSTHRRKSRFKYSYPWALEVVELFTEKYARGTEFLCLAARIPHEVLIRNLVKAVRNENQVYWESMKLMIKLCQAENFYRDFSTIPVKDRRKYLTIIRQNAIDSVLLRMKRKDENLDGYLDLDYD